MTIYDANLLFSQNRLHDVVKHQEKGNENHFYSKVVVHNINSFDGVLHWLDIKHSIQFGKL